MTCYANANAAAAANANAAVHQTVVTDPTVIFLAKFLDDFEAAFDRAPEEQSPEMQITYIQAAEHLAKMGRTNNRIREVDSYLRGVVAIDSRPSVMLDSFKSIFFHD